MTVGIYRPKFSHRRSQEVPYSEKYPDRSLLIIGAGMAGAACACEFARRGWKVTVIDEGRVAASAASAIRYAIAHFQPAGDENLLLDFLELVLTCSKRSAVIFLNISTLMDCRRSPETRRSTKSGRDGFKITSLSSFRIIFEIVKPGRSLRSNRLRNFVRSLTAPSSRISGSRSFCKRKTFFLREHCVSLIPECPV